MRFSNKIKGTLTQTLVKTVLEEAGYNIAPLGIEEVLREVKSLSPEDYKTLGLPVVVRRMPDFFVFDKELKKSWLVEVKYRDRWNDETRDKLKEELSNQAASWQPIYLILFLRKGAKQHEMPSSNIGVIKLEHRDGELVHPWISPMSRKKNLTPWDKVGWGSFSRIQDVFKKLDTKDARRKKTLFDVQDVLLKFSEADI